MIEIRIHGRGGQGAVVASKILADAAFREGHSVQTFPQFGVERRGAPVAAFVRIADPDEPLWIRCHVTTPHIVIVLDATLLETAGILEGLRDGGIVLVNSPQPPDALAIPSKYQVATVDASAIALKHKLGTRTQPIVNTAILGAFVKVTRLVRLESVLEAIRENVPVDPEGNVRAAEEAFATVLSSARAAA
ncbi:MAG: 2-oxoacid:acceptor oxidoreductase family protein [Armatimonadota bacterium]|nr:2-oxoacid:acceptor oxidoreductase family protein [Armatimonadota bacterium]MDR5702097.1 2-oxoacid:acceptor oxidoreductase family protein [Armatimonadota bacterium]MDR7434622.1 2-oxoacid:acceptor oxidoreductase family protein [Armatimonadota bacterium]